ncbi:MAG: type 4a pilus biogenesis protein PilO [Candidatus Omnitrophica bacterium]|nr:type 4a pilus biogenesis protein PilO [Candidatus Omnitrophota bacterium]
MKLALSKPERRAILAVGSLALVIGWLYAAHLVLPLHREAGRLAQQVQSARQRIRTLEAAVANEDSFRAQHQQWDEKVKSLRVFLPPQEELPAVIERLSALANQTQVKIETISPQRSLVDHAKADVNPDTDKPPQPGPGPKGYEEVLIQVEALAGYHQLGAFLNAVEAGDRVVRVATLRMVGNPRDLKRHQIKLWLRAYFAASEHADPGVM